ncbi:MAG: cytochrome P450 [Gammaproteobacteria bacterium]
MSVKVEAKPVPAHIPPDLVREYDSFDPKNQDDPWGFATRLLDYPRVFWTRTAQGGKDGSWVVTHMEDVREVLQNADIFSSNDETGFSKLVGENWWLIPLELDAPRHPKWRAIVNPLFAPNKVNALEGWIRDWCDELINRVRDRGECEFIYEFARPFPVTIILKLLGLPLERMDEFLEWEDMLLHSGSPEIAGRGCRAMVDNMRAEIDKRRRNPGEDLISWALQAKIDGEPVPENEILGFCMLMFIGGLDTVVSSLGFFFKHLAEHPGHQQRLRSDPDITTEAVEEYLRAHAVVTSQRQITRDTVLAGTALRKGDWITVVMPSASRDPKEYPNPEVIDFDRENKANVAFAYGPHRCLGSHLARREMRIAFERWMKLVPEFRIKPGTRPKLHSAGVYGVDELFLTWR